MSELTKEQRIKVEDGLFDEMVSSSFAEGCEGRIARALESLSDVEIIKLAREKGTWTPTPDQKAGAS